MLGHIRTCRHMKGAGIMRLELQAPARRQVSAGDSGMLFDCLWNAGELLNDRQRWDS